jgi:Trk K+ transport system NAD-binding subunit
MTELFKSRPIYDVMLERMLLKDQICYTGNEGKKTIIEIPVSLGSYLDQKQIKDVIWPKECLLVGVVRGGKEIIPKGNTKLQMGDYLVVLTNRKDEALIHEFLNKLARETRQ